MTMDFYSITSEVHQVREVLLYLLLRSGGAKPMGRDRGGQAKTMVVEAMGDEQAIAKSMDVQIAIHIQPATCSAVVRLGEDASQLCFGAIRIWSAWNLSYETVAREGAHHVTLEQ